MEFTSQSLSLVFITLVLCSCKPSSGAKNAPIEPDKSMSVADLKMEKMKVQSYGPQGLEWEMRAPIAESHTKENKVTAHDLLVRLYDQGEISTTISSDHGIMNAQKVDDPNSTSITVNEINLKPGDMYLNGHVVVISTSGTKILTDWAHYQRDKEQIFSKAPVRVLREDSITEGVGLIATSDLSDIQIFNQKVVIKDRSE